MSSLHYIRLSFQTSRSMSLLLFIEMFVLIIIINIALGEYNSRTMLFEPVEPYLNKQGFLVDRISESLDDAEPLKSINEELKEISGTADPESLEIKIYADPYISFDIIPDKVFEKLQLPTTEGELFDVDNNSEICQIVVSPNDYGYSAGDRIKINGNEVEIAAVLTDPTSLMRLSYDYQMSYESMYFNYEKSYYSGIPQMYTCESEFQKLNVDQRNVSIHPISLVSFNNRLTEEEFERIKEELNKRDIYLIDNRDIMERSQKILSDDFKRFIPSAFVFGTITIIGVLSCSIIGTRSILKKLVLFYCCGATKADCVKIASGKMIVILLSTGAAAALMIFILKTLRVLNLIGFVFKINNVIVTIIIILGTAAVSMIAPMILISKKDVCRLLTETE